ncbi:MAG: ABC transporter permease, partial [bacterium]
LLGWGVLSRSLVEVFPVWVADLIAQFSFTTHFNNLRRGLIDLADLVFFLSIIGVMLYANVLVLEKNRSS